MKRFLAASLVIVHIMAATFFLVLACRRIATAQDAKPAAKQKAERSKFAHERVGVFECRGLCHVNGQLAMKFSLLSEDSEVHNTVEVVPWLLQIGVYKEAGTVLSYSSDQSAALLELPTEEAAVQWQAYLEALRKSCLYVVYVAYPGESDCSFVFEDRVGICLVIYDRSIHEIPASGSGKIGRVSVKLDDIKVLVEKGVKMHAVVEWGKALAHELPGEGSSGERYYYLEAPNITVYVPDSDTQEAWQTRIETERRKLAPHVVFPPAEVK